MTFNRIKLIVQITLLCLLSLCATSVVVSDEEPNANCADFNNTTWQKYRRTKGVHVQYLLLTRKNAGCASLFTQHCLSHTQKHTSHFNSTLPTKVIIHGYSALGRKPSWVSGLAQALLEKEDANILVVDWLCGASYAYNQVVDNYKEVAVQISVLINQLKTSGINLESFHLIGISVGAHVAGFVGTLFGGKLGRITGLDPAGPMFKKADPFDRLDPSDAMFVEAIHTDSDYFGISIPVGHVDFFVNGGLDQTGCVRSSFASVYGYVICDHMRALHVYMSALNGSCELTGFPCSSYENFLAGQCTSCDGPFNNVCPQIVNHIMIELKVSPLSKSAVVQVTLVSMQDIKTKKEFQLQTNKAIYKTVVGHPEHLCKIDSIHLKNIGAFLYRQGNIHFEYICISKIPKTRTMDTLCVENIKIGRSAPWTHDFIQAC